MFKAIAARLVRAFALCLVLTGAAQAAPPATVSVAVPGNVTFGIGQSLDLFVNWNQTVFVSGTPSISLVVGTTTKQASYISGSGTSQLRFRYQVAESDYDLDGITVGALGLNGGTILNAGSEVANLTLNSVGSTAWVLVDGIRPTATMSLVGTPAGSDASVQYNLTFNQAVTGVDISDFELTLGAGVSGRVALVTTSNNITYLITVDDLAGQGTIGLALKDNTNIGDSVGNAPEGFPGPVHSVARPFGLSGFSAPGVAFSPAFDRDTLSYAASVPASPSTISITFNGEGTGTIIRANGTTYASGATIPFALVAGSNVLTVATETTQGIVTTYTITVTRAAASANAELAALVPSAGSLSPAFAPGTAAYQVSVGNEIDTFSLTPTVADPDATVVVNGTPVTSGSTSPSATLAVGANPFSVVVTAQSGDTFTYTVDVTRGTGSAMPDPSANPTVEGIANAQSASVRGMLNTQVSNLTGRMQQLHNETSRRQNSIDVQMALSAFGPDVSQAMGYLPKIDPLAGVDLGPFAVWAGGFVDFGKSGSGLDLSSVTVGVSGGLDYRFSDFFTGGFGIGLGRDRTDIGGDGSRSETQSVTGALYGSYKPIDNFFIDGLIGAGSLDLDSRRFISASDFALGKRNGRQLFGSLTASYEFREGKWLLAPYGRLDASRSWLDGYSETGGAGMALAYGDQTIDSLSGTAGIRAEYGFDMDWGTLTPGARAEFTHGSEASSRMELGYVAVGGMPYAIGELRSTRNTLSLGLSLDAYVDTGLTLGIDYQASASGDWRSQGVSLRLRSRF